MILVRLLRSIWINSRPGQCIQKNHYWMHCPGRELLCCYFGNEYCLSNTEHYIPSSHITILRTDQETQHLDTSTEYQDLMMITQRPRAPNRLTNLSQLYPRKPSTSEHLQTPTPTNILKFLQLIMSLDNSGQIRRSPSRVAFAIIFTKNFSPAVGDFSPENTETAELFFPPNLPRTSKDKAEFKQGTQHGVCLHTHNRHGCKPKKVGSGWCEDGKTDMLVYAYPPRIRWNRIYVHHYKGRAPYMTVSFSDWMRGRCGAVNRFPGMKGSHGSSRDCSNYHTRSEFVASIESKPIYLCPCGNFAFTWKAVGGGDW